MVDQTGTAWTRKQDVAQVNRLNKRILNYFKELLFYVNFKIKLAKIITSKLS